MRRLVTFSIATLIVLVPAVLLARVLFESPEDQLGSIVTSIESQRSGALLDTADFGGAGLVISAGAESRRFDEGGRAGAREMLEAATGLDAADRVRLRQQQVTVSEDRATAILNVEVDEGDYVALRLELSNRDGQWLVERIRIMG
jgi:hypothetical protein